MAEDGDNQNDGLKPETLTAQALHRIDPVTGAIVPPLYASSTYARDASYELIDPKNLYARDDQPTGRVVEELLARLEGGAEAMLFGSGNTAGTAVLLAALKPGDHLLLPKVMYWALRNWMVDFSERWGVDCALYDETDPDAIEAAIKPGKTRIVWVETPANPTWSVTDIARAAEAAHGAGAYLVVDSTAATPVHCRPLALGADLVFHSATKYLNGHSDLTAGALVARRTDELWDELHVVRRHAGQNVQAFENWLLLRGLRTLHVRVRQQSANALAIARHFEGHPKVEAVHYPGLESHPGHVIAKRQMAGGFGGMLSIEAKGGFEGGKTVAKACNVWVRATSLGGVESLIEHRPSVEQRSTLPPGLLRLSTGIEAVEDLIADLEQALEQV